MATLIDIRLKQGERGLIVGQTGSGKTYAAAWMLRYANQRVVILDTKHEPLFERVPKGVETLEICESPQDMLRLWKDKKKGPDYILVRPPPALMADPMAIDQYLYNLYDNATNCFIYIDEAYQLHKGSLAGPGLIAILTRGRARGITTLVSTQRPAWLSRFALTESQKFFLFRIIDKKDWARLGEIIPGVSDGIKLQPYEFLYYVQGDEEFQRMKPLPPIAQLSYTPQSEPETDEPRRRWF
jgi:DNA helicase HerA-like ATPase